MRALITEATGLVPDLPKTVGVGCGRRRPTGRTSSHAASVLTCGRHLNPRSDLHGCRWLSLADMVDRIRSCDGPQTAPQALYLSRKPSRLRRSNAGRALIMNRST